MKALLVVGAESSGTRLWAEILVKSGAAGDYGHEQRFDTGLPQATQPIVWRRSFPHARAWPDIVDMQYQLVERGYMDPVAIVTTRDWTAMAKSQVAAGHVPDESTALDNIRRAYRYILDGLAKAEMPYVMVGFEALVQRPAQTIRQTFDLLGWDGAMPDITIRDENAKWLS